MNKSDKQELIGQIIDIFEDYLDAASYGDECSRMDDDGEWEEVWIDFVEKTGDSVWICGGNYDNIAKQIEATLKSWGLLS